MKQLLFLACAVSAMAHDFYLLPERFFIQPGDKLAVRFQNGDSFPESEVSPVMDRLREPALLTPFAVHGIDHLKEQGRVPPKTKREKPAAKFIEGTVTVPEKGTLVLIARTVPNPIELPAEEFTKYLKEEGLEAVVAWREQHGESAKPGRERYTKFAKSLIQSGEEPDDFYQQKTSLALEFIPETNPLTLKPGASLPVRLLLQGKPAKGVQVELASAPDAGQPETKIVGRTDAAGRITATLPATGRYRLHAVIMGLCPEKSIADWESLWTSLTFAIR